MTGEIDYHGALRIVYDFQALLTGVGAIVAAAYTVISMYRIDAKQQIRHAEVLGLTYRQEYATLDRLIVGHKTQLFTSTIVCGQLYEAIHGSAEVDNEALKHADEIWFIVRETQNSLLSPEFKAALEYADGAMVSAYRETESICETIRVDALKLFMFSTHAGTMSDAEFQQEFDAVHRDKAGSRDTVIAGIGRLSGTLRNLTAGIVRLENRHSALVRIYPQLAR